VAVAFCTPQTDDDLKSRHPYKEWMEKNVRRLVPFEDLSDEEVGIREMDDDLLRYPETV
jgi:glutamate synthase (NADPH/NADH) large chain